MERRASRTLGFEGVEARSTVSHAIAAAGRGLVHVLLVEQGEKLHVGGIEAPLEGHGNVRGERDDETLAHLGRDALRRLAVHLGATSGDGSGGRWRLAGTRRCSGSHGGGRRRGGRGARFGGSRLGRRLTSDAEEQQSERSVLT